MPIAVRCKCGHAMNVPNSAAGKVGKCPKCQQPIKVPGSASPAQTPTAKQKAAAPVQQKVATSASGMDKLFADAGIGVSKGPVCPSCEKPVPPNSAICVHCGYHFERGERLTGHQSADEAIVGFDNMYLDEAAKNMKLDKEAEARTTYAGAPWWVMLAIVLAVCILIVAGVEKVQAVNTGKFAPKGSIIRPMQRMSILMLISYIGMIISAMVFCMSFIAVAFNAFKDSVSKGFMMLIPLYSHFYAIVNRKKLDTTATVHLLWTVLLIVFTIWFFANQGQKAFREAPDKPQIQEKALILLSGAANVA